MSNSALVFNLLGDCQDEGEMEYVLNAAADYGIHKVGTRWQARVRQKHIGMFDCPLMAHLAYKDYINTLNK